MHKYNPDIHNRRSIRLRDYDYSQPGAYFLTVCTYNRKCLFGQIIDGKMEMSKYGQVVMECWGGLPNHYAHVELDTFTIMPNHVHGIIMLIDNSVGAGVRAGLKPAPTSISTPAPTSKRHGLPEIVRAFKTFSSRHINQIRHTPSIPVWQRNYYEHIIRNDDKLNSIREYIINNPARWAEDENNPDNM